MFRIAVIFVAALIPISTIAADEYLKDVKPVLQARCYACHGGLKQEGGLRLDTAESIRKGGDSGSAIDSTQTDSSTLLIRITSTDHSVMMPPDGERLKGHEIAAIRKWITAGAPSPEGEIEEEDPRNHWAFRSPVAQPLPDVPDSEWNRNPIDAFIADGHRRNGLQPQPTADKLTWLRRVTIDLTGLPPTPTEQNDFLADTSDAAYDRVVDRLLNDPAYGERWGRHWMDIWRYSDWWGLGAEVRNSQKHIWHWRDWIVESLNEDKAYDQMLREMLAADELYPQDEKRLRAGGYLARQYFKFNRTSWLDETIQHTSKAMLGLTLNCGKCHDHKYDPFTQTEYYQLRAFFEPYQVRTDLTEGALDVEQNGIPRPFDCNLDAPTWVHVRGDDRNPDQTRPIEPALPAFLKFADFPISPVQLPAESVFPGLRRQVIDTLLTEAEKKIKAARSSLDAAVRQSDELARRPSSGQATTGDETPTVIAQDNFSRQNPELWTVRAGVWEWKNNAAIQTQTGPTQAALTLKKNVPRDFEATIRYVPRGGDMWKSAGIRFDVVGTDDVMVYLSSVAGSSKSQIAWTQNGQQAYPGDALQNREVPLNEPQILKVQVRDTLVNVYVNGQFSIARRLPFPRRDGAFEIMAFDLIGEFMEFQLTSLPLSVPMQEDDNAESRTLTPEIAALKIEEAQHQLDAAMLEPGVIKAKVAATEAMFRAAETPETLQLRQSAFQVEHQHRLHSALAELARAKSMLAAAIPEKRGEAEKAVSAAQAMVESVKSALASGGTEFTALPGSLKTLENNLESEESRRKPFPRTSTGRRTALAQWITDARNPLTARVAVNHVWTRHFGRGIVASVFDFGRKGTAPTHPELLDWLAVDFMKNGWNMKRLHRMIVLSRTYRSTSSTLHADTQSLARDPENRFFWRTNPVRLEAQAVRDSLLHISGQLDRTMGGPTVPVNDEKSRRRSLYYFHSHNEHQKFLSIFDDASVLECYRRAESIVPQQALAMVNSELIGDVASAITERLSSCASDSEFVAQAFRLVLSCDPTPDESATCVDAIRSLLADSEGNDDAIRRARIVLVVALLNHNDFVTVR